MEQDKVRADFEAAMNAEAEAGGYEVDWSRSEVDAERYANPAVRSAWWGWQASREAVFVELPEEDKAGFGGADGPLGPSIEQIEAAGYNCGVKACRAAIHAAGIRTR